MRANRWIRLSVPSAGRLEIDLRSVYSATLLHAGVPLVAGAHSEHEPGTDPLRLDLEAFGTGWRLEATSAADWNLVPDANLRSVLEGVTGMRRARIRLSGTRESTSAETEISLHDAWHWPLLPDLWSVVAAHVLPHDGVVLRLLSDCRDHTALPDLRDVFEVLRTTREIRSTPPAVTRTPEGVTVQVIRPPWCVIGDTLRGQGSCLDLSLLVAGVLEAAGQAPLVLFFLDADGHPEHAIPGMWKDGSRRFRPFLTSGEVGAALERGEIVVADVTRVCRDQETSFRRARSDAEARLRSELRAVDILALRPPYGGVAPFETSCESVVLAAVAEAEGVAREAGTNVVETLHLLHGLWQASGPIASQLLLDNDWSREEVLAWCRKEMNSRPITGPAGRTRGFERCLAEARENARAQGATLVREADLWWAVLGSRSSSLDRVFAQRPKTRERLLEVLAELSPSSRPESL